MPKKAAIFQQHFQVLAQMLPTKAVDQQIGIDFIMVSERFSPDQLQIFLANCQISAKAKPVVANSIIFFSVFPVIHNPCAASSGSAFWFPEMIARIPLQYGLYILFFEKLELISDSMMTLGIKNYENTIVGINLRINRSFDSSLSSHHLTRMTRMIRI